MVWEMHFDALCFYDSPSKRPLASLELLSSRNLVNIWTSSFLWLDRSAKRYDFHRFHNAVLLQGRHFYQDFNSEIINIVGISIIPNILPVYHTLRSISSIIEHNLFFFYFYRVCLYFALSYRLCVHIFPGGVEQNERSKQNGKCRNWNCLITNFVLNFYQWLTSETSSKASFFQIILRKGPSWHSSRNELLEITIINFKCLGKLYNIVSL